MAGQWMMLGRGGWVVVSKKESKKKENYDLE